MDRSRNRLGILSRYPPLSPGTIRSYIDLWAEEGTLRSSAQWAKTLLPAATARKTLTRQELRWDSREVSFYISLEVVVVINFRNIPKTGLA